MEGCRRWREECKGDRQIRKWVGRQIWRLELLGSLWQTSGRGQVDFSELLKSVPCPGVAGSQPGVWLELVSPGSRGSQGSGSAHQCCCSLRPHLGCGGFGSPEVPSFLPSVQLCPPA